MNILVIGSGSVAHCFAQWLGSLGHSVLMYQLFCSKNHGFLPISSCWLGVNGIILSDPNPHALMTAGQRPLDCSDFDTILCVGTIERVQELLCSSLWESLVNEDLILLTSWHGLHDQLCEQLPSNILPAYPVITCEHWDQHLVAFGSSLLEIDCHIASNTRWNRVIVTLKSLGFKINLTNMATRFRARFSTTSFAYSYIRSLPGHECSSTRLDFNLERGTHQLRILLDGHPDLVDCIVDLPSSLEKLWMQRDRQGAVGWVIDTLMRKKLGKTDYFIDRMPIGINPN